MKINDLTKIVILSLIFLIFQETSLFSFDLKNKSIPFKEEKKIFNKYKKHIENSTWVVPPSTLLAYLYVNGERVPVSDQTVWVINKFEQGYFFGDAYISINQVPSSQRSIVGSITPYGDVYITFYPLGGTGSTEDIVNGIGKFIKQDGQYVFVMQMNSASNASSGLSHWSYMLSVKKGDVFYRHLPGENMSVPEFISQFQ